MKYKIVLSSENEAHHNIYEYALEDEYGNKSYWIEWHKDEKDNIIRTSYTDSKDKSISVETVIRLNKDNPEESIERLKKLQLLK